MSLLVITMSPYILLVLLADFNKILHNYKWALCRNNFDFCSYYLKILNYIKKILKMRVKKTENGVGADKLEYILKHL